MIYKKGGDTMNNYIREYAKSKGVKLWEIADRLGMHDSNFSKMLRHHLTLEKEKQIIKIIDTIAGIHGR